MTLYVPIAENSRFREIEPGVTVELISTLVEMRYVPASPEATEGLTARWWAQEFMPIAGGHQVIGKRGISFETRLADYATTVLDAGIDPVTGDPIRLSYLGMTQWFKVAFDHQHNHQFPKPAPPDEPEEDPQQ